MTFSIPKTWTRMGLSGTYGTEQLYLKVSEPCARGTTQQGGYYAGRGDGENAQSGFVDVCDTPYSETVRAAREIAERMYARRGSQ